MPRVRVREVHPVLTGRLYGRRRNGEIEAALLAREDHLEWLILDLDLEAHLIGDGIDQVDVKALVMGGSPCSNGGYGISEATMRVPSWIRPRSVLSSLPLDESSSSSPHPATKAVANRPMIIAITSQSRGSCHISLILPLGLVRDRPEPLRWRQYWAVALRLNERQRSIRSIAPRRSSRARSRSMAPASQRVHRPSTKVIRICAASSGSASRRIEPSSLPRWIPAATVALHLRTPCGRLRAAPARRRRMR